LTILLSSDNLKKLNIGEINMQTKKITLNADKRKVIADQFQSFYEDKVKDKLVQAKEQYDIMREKAKVAIEKVVRFHQPQEDVDTINKLRKQFADDCKDELSHTNLFTLCSKHHKLLHSIYGQRYSNYLAPKIKNWLERKIFANYPTSGIVIKINSRKLQLLREKSLSKNNEWQYAIEK